MSDKAYTNDSSIKTPGTIFTSSIDTLNGDKVLYTQTPTFLDGSAPSLAETEALRAAARYLKASKAANTHRAYDAAWTQYSGWCVAAERPLYCDDMAQIGLYLAARASDLCAASLDVHLAGIAYAFRTKSVPFDVRHPAIAEIMAGIRREQRGRERRQAQALTPALLKDALSHMHDGAADLRDKALLLVGYGLGARRSELIGLRHSDVRIDTRGLEIHVAYSKTDQTGAGSYVGLCRGADPAFCPQAALEAWLACKSQQRPTQANAPVFTRIRKGGDIGEKPLSGEAVTLILKRALERAGHSSIGFSAHSLRSGLITASRQLGLDLDDIMAQSRHTDRATAMGYVRRESIWDSNVTAALFG